MNFGIDGCNFLAQENTSNRLIPRISIMIPIIIPNINEAVELRVKAEPIIPITPPRTKNDTILPE